MVLRHKRRPLPVGKVLQLQFLDWTITGLLRSALPFYVKSIGQEFAEWNAFISAMARILGPLVVLFMASVVRLHYVFLCLMTPLLSIIGYTLFLSGAISFGSLITYMIVPVKILWAGGHLPLLFHVRTQHDANSKSPVDFN